MLKNIRLNNEGGNGMETIFGNSVTDGRFEWVTREKDISLLKYAIKLGYKAREAGNEPYASVLAGPQGEILVEGLNTCFTDNDPTAHGEMNLVRQAAAKFSPDFLWQCSIYVPGTPCPMCCCAIFYANIGRLVTATSIYDDGEYTAWNVPNLCLTPEEIWKKGNKDIVISGPYPELAEECKAKLIGFNPLDYAYYQKTLPSLIKK